MKEDSKEKKNLGSEDEEKMEGSPRHHVARNTLEILQENLPEGLSKKKKYNHESDLLEDLKKLDLTDLQIILDDEGYAIWREPEASRLHPQWRGRRDSNY
jgi:hypothetical protein